MISAKRLDVLRVIAKETFSLALIDTKRLRGKILSVLWQGILKGTALMNRCKFDSSNKKQMRDFRKDWTNCCLDFLRLQIKLLKINCKIWFRKSSEVWIARWASIRFMYHNWVFKHHTRKTLHNNKIKNMLDCISKWQDWLRNSQQYRETFEEHRSVESVAGQKFTDFDEEEKNSHKKYDVTKMTEQNLSLSIWNISKRLVSSWITQRNYPLVM